MKEFLKYIAYVVVMMLAYWIVNKLGNLIF